MWLYKHVSQSRSQLAFIFLLKQVWHDDKVSFAFFSLSNFFLSRKLLFLMNNCFLNQILEMLIQTYTNFFFFFFTPPQEHGELNSCSFFINVWNNKAQNEKRMFKGFVRYRSVFGLLQRFHLEHSERRTVSRRVRHPSKVNSGRLNFFLLLFCSVYVNLAFVHCIDFYLCGLCQTNPLRSAINVAEMSRCKLLGW